jgi:DNA (cytosine-5)-methyltransferase 1
MNELQLFAGTGGGILGSILLGHRTVCAVEIEEYPRKVLLQRQRDGILPWFPIWDDINTFDGKPWNGIVDIVAGGFPCQDISAAGKGVGIGGKRSGLWTEMARVVYEIRPRFVFVENSPMLTSRGLGRVLRDLAELGYDARWCVLGANDTGAPHKRKRIWILAYPRRKHGKAWDSSRLETNSSKRTAGTIPDQPISPRQVSQTWKTMPETDGMVNGVANIVDRLKAIGNGQVPAVVATAWTILSEGLV